MAFIPTIYIVKILQQIPNTHHTHHYEYQSWYSIYIQFFDSPFVQVYCWITSYPEFISAVATAVMAVFTARLWLSTHRLWEEARKASEIAKDAAEASKSQAELAFAEYLESHIPRLIVRRVQLRRDTTPRGIEFVLANIGDSYAQDISGDLNIKIIQRSEMRSFERNSIPLYEGKHYDISRMIKSPETGHDATLQAGEKQPIFIQSDKITDDIYSRMTKDEVLYFYGKIRYWNRTKSISREMGFFRTCVWSGNNWIFEAKEDDPDYEWN